MNTIFCDLPLGLMVQISLDNLHFTQSTCFKWISQGSLEGDRLESNTVVRIKNSIFS
jgi:hypothetical protein